MKLVWDDTILVERRFVLLYPVDADDPPDLDEAFEGQVNGLLGGASAAALVFFCALHTGEVSLRIEWDVNEPDLDPAHTDVVEISVDVLDTQMRLVTFPDGSIVNLPIIGPHRARLCASGLDEASDQEATEPGETAPDSYLLQLWPAPSGPDRIVRLGSEYARRCHAEQAAAQDAEIEEPDEWDRQRDEELSVIGDIPPDHRRAAAVALAHMACEYAAIIDVPSVRDALDLLKANGPRPPALADLRSFATEIIASIPPRPTEPEPHVGWPQRIFAATRVIAAAFLDPRQTKVVAPRGPASRQNADIFASLGQTKIAADRMSSPDPTLLRELQARLSAT